MDNIINKMKYELGDLKYQLMVLKEENRVMHLRNNEQAKKNDPDGFVRKDVYELMFDKATRQDNTIENLLNENSKLKKKFDNAVSELFENSKLKTNANSKMVFKLENKVSELLSENKEMKEKVERQGKTIQRLYNDTKINGCRYAFSNIPNDEEGNKFVEQMKLYFNYDSYDFRKRGQYLDNDKLSIGETWKTYEDGQPLSKSKCIRIYIDKKKEGK
jgi:regulator of replication initiation timing